MCSLQEIQSKYKHIERFENKSVEKKMQGKPNKNEQGVDHRK